MQILIDKLIKLYLNELLRLNIGYEHDKDVLIIMYDLMNAIDLIQHGNLTSTEILKIISYYE